MAQQLLGVADPYRLYYLKINANFEEIYGAVGGGRARMGDGTAAAPAYSFASDEGTGIFRPAGGGLGFAVDGIQYFKVYSDGSFGTPGMTAPNSTAAGTEEGVVVRPIRLLQAVRADSEAMLCGRKGSAGPTFLFRMETTTVGNISVDASSTAYNTNSDYRLKENVIPLTGALARLADLKPYRFSFKGYPEKTLDGFFAHEAVEVVPEAVTGEKDAVDEEGQPIHQGIDQAKLVPLLTAALQEAVQRIEALESQIGA